MYIRGILFLRVEFTDLSGACHDLYASTPPTLEFISAAIEAQGLHPGISNLSASDVKVSCGNKALPQLKILGLSGNQIGDAGVAALASACGSGALPNLTRLGLDGNQIGDDGMQALAAAIGSGALPKLEWLAT